MAVLVKRWVFFDIGVRPRLPTSVSKSMDGGAGGI
jgi:hypothetical protein